MAIPPGQRRKIASDKNELITPQMNTLMNMGGAPPHTESMQITVEPL